MSTSSKPVPSAPAGSRKSPVTEVIEATTGPAVRRIRKLRVEVVDALMETHLRGEDQQGPLRALRGMAEANRGPWSKIVDALPVRLRKAATAGPVQAGLRVTHEAFFARLEKRTRAALESAPKWSQR